MDPDQDFRDEYRKALDRALRLLQHNDRTVYEIAEKLRRNEYQEDVIDAVVEYLVQEHFLDDRRYAEYYVVCYQTKRSRRRIKKGLVDKGIDEAIISLVMEDCDDTEALLKTLDKQLGKFGFTSTAEVPWDTRQKISAALYRQGFGTDRITKLF